MAKQHKKAEIEYLKTADIKPYDKNPRKNEEAVKAVAASIQEFGFKVPIVVDNKNVIVCGHTRWKAALDLNLQEVPCIRADDLTKEQIKAYRLADNKVAELAGWDFELLSEELDGIAEIDMSQFGFDLNIDLNIDDFFEDSETKGEKEDTPQYVKCPCCDQMFELKEEYIQ